VGARIRVLLVNTSKLNAADISTSLETLIGPAGGVRSGMAYPLFGTSASHAAALYATLGPERARAFYEKLRASGVRVVDGNSVVRDLVANGQLSIGLTDSDDACGAVAKGAPVRILIPGQDGDGAMIIPGTVALVRGGPHFNEGRRLIDWLVSERGERRLIDSGFCQLSLRSGRAEGSCPAAGPVKALNVNLEDIAAQFERSRSDMGAIFVR
jgi:iron(III) transport system substrate-binding protein